MSAARCIATLLPLLCAALTACGDDSDGGNEGNTRRMQTPAPPPQAIDAGAAAASPRKPDNPVVATPGDTYHLDTASSDIWQPKRKRSVPARTLRLTLRSTPPGATAFVDGSRIGPTPTYWEGAATGKPRNFVFTLRGHAMARYRFVPTTDGVVHATLKKLAAEPVDAGLPTGGTASPAPPGL